MTDRLAIKTWFFMTIFLTVLPLYVVLMNPDMDIQDCTDHSGKCINIIGFICKYFLYLFSLGTSIIGCDLAMYLHKTEQLIPTMNIERRCAA